MLACVGLSKFHEPVEALARAQGSTTSRFPMIVTAMVTALWQENSLLMGQYFAVRKRRLCEPYRDWFESIPNDGIIRYKFLFNTERLLPTSPDTLREVLLTKAYDYVKPFQLRQALSKIIGRGIILQEHDEHRYLRKHSMSGFDGLKGICH